MPKGQRLSLRAVERNDLPRYEVWQVTDHLKAILSFNFNDESNWDEAQCKVAPVAALWKKAGGKTQFFVNDVLRIN